MKASLVLGLGALALPSASATPVGLRDASQSKSFMGTNLYFLPGMSDEDQDTYINDIANYGAKVVRVWVNPQSGGSCEKGTKIAVSVPKLEDKLGQYNDQALDAVDKVVNKLAQKGIKSIISPHDGNAFLNDYRKDIYSETWNKQTFYTSQDAFDAYDRRIDHILNYTGKASGKQWKTWSDAILAFDLQNEPMSADNSVCNKDGDKAGWICGRAKHMRETLGADNKIRIASGGVGGDISHGCTFAKAATGCAALDLIAVHRYAGSQESQPNQWSNGAKSWTGQSGGKLVFVEEWGVDTSKTKPETELVAQAGDLNKAGLPNLYWQILPRKNGGCSYNPASDSGDTYGIFAESDVDIASVMKGASSATAAQDWSSFGG
ncbi:glycoside hydrolase family 5 protein [Hypoxylon sp. NC1633]|nr:glycoside hydrolase family 5 protein [Hypoxylon sp. NC1633]